MLLFAVQSCIHLLLLAGLSWYETGHHLWLERQYNLKKYTHVTVVSVLLGYDAASLGNWFPSILDIISLIFKGANVQQ
jgi:hypothetical protein